MEFTGVKNDKRYTITVKGGKVRSILVEVINSFERRFYQRGAANVGLIMDEKIFEEAVMAFCKKNLLSWMELFDAIWDDKFYGQDLMQKIFEKHLM